MAFDFDNDERGASSTGPYARLFGGRGTETVYIVAREKSVDKKILTEN